MNIVYYGGRLAWGHMIYNLGVNNYLKYKDKETHRTPSPT